MPPYPGALKPSVQLLSLTSMSFGIGTFFQRRAVPDAACNSPGVLILVLTLWFILPSSPVLSNRCPLYFCFVFLILNRKVGSHYLICYYWKQNSDNNFFKYLNNIFLIFIILMYESSTFTYILPRNIKTDSREIGVQ